MQSIEGSDRKFWYPSHFLMSYGHVELDISPNFWFQFGMGQNLKDGLVGGLKIHFSRLSHPSGELAPATPFRGSNFQGADL